MATLSERTGCRGPNYNITNKALRRGDFKHFRAMLQGSEKLRDAILRETVA